jgi:hypothetical protein
MLVTLSWGLRVSCPVLVTVRALAAVSVNKPGLHMHFQQSMRSVKEFLLD